jgi:hypothetical protein
LATTALVAVFGVMMVLVGSLALRSHGHDRDIVQAAHASRSSSNAAAVSVQKEVRDTVVHHFEAIEDGDYGAAWEDLVGPAAGGGEAAWIAESRDDHLRAFSLNVATDILGKNEAKATIRHFKTYEEGACKLWSGFWSLIQSRGRWFIYDAAMTSHSCG